MTIAQADQKTLIDNIIKLNEKFSDFFNKTDPSSLTLTDIIANFSALVLLAGSYLFLLALVAAGAMYIYAFGSEEAVGKARKALIYSFLGFIVFVSANAGLNYYMRLLGKVAGAVPSLAAVVGRVFNAVLVVGGLGFFIVLVYSGIRYFFTSGNEEQTAETRKAIVFALIGLIIMIAAWAMGTYIIGKVIF